MSERPQNRQDSGALRMILLGFGERPNVLAEADRLLTPGYSIELIGFHSVANSLYELISCALNA